LGHLKKKRKRKRKKNLVQKPKMTPQQSLDMQHLEAELQANQVPTLVFSEIVTEDITKNLEKYGAVLISMSDEEMDWHALKVEMGCELSATFPHLSSPIHEDLKVGCFAKFNQNWNKNKVESHRIMLSSYGMPCPVPLSKEVQKQQTDPVTKAVFRKYPVAANGPNLAWKRIGTHLLPDDSFVPGDGLKTKAGSKRTPLHSDGVGTRVQAILLGDDADARRHLHVVPTTDKVLTLMEKITGVKHVRKNGFSTLKKFVEVEALLMKYSQTVRGLLMFQGALHHEVDNNRGSGETFRVYCGYVNNGRQLMSVDLRVTMAYYRTMGYDCDPYAIQINAKNIPHAFSNAKTTQYYQVREENVDPNLPYNVSLKDMQLHLLQTATEEELQMFALSKVELERNPCGFQDVEETLRIPRKKQKRSK
jgi:hypothetical protein